MRYLAARNRQRNEEKAYWRYMSKCAELSLENFARRYGGSTMRLSFENILEPKKVDARSGEQIVADVIKNCGLKVVS